MTKIIMIMQFAAMLVHMKSEKKNKTESALKS